MVQVVVWKDEGVTERATVFSGPLIGIILLHQLVRWQSCLSLWEGNGVTVIILGLSWSLNGVN